MFAGRLRYRWTIQRKSVTRSATGDEIVTWPNVAEVWAEEKDRSGNEVLRGTVAIAQKITTLSIRWRSGITPAMRMTRDGRVLDIEQVLNPDGRKRELELLCTEVVK